MTKWIHPTRHVELEEVVRSDDDEGVFDERREALHRLEDADHDHHHAGEQDRSGGPAARLFVLHLSHVLSPF